MKQVAFKLMVILFYLLIIVQVIGFDLFVLFDPLLIGLVLIGAIMLSLPNIKRKMPLKEIGQVVSMNVMFASYTVTFLLLFARLSDVKGYDELLIDISLNFRPVLYGLIIYFLLKQDESHNKNMESDEQSLETMTPEQIYFKFRNAGLTEREAEIARLAINRLSNGEIAEELCIAESTVKKHMSHIFEKLKITARDELRTYFDLRKK